MSDLTTEGISALKTGNKVRARNFLKLAIQENPKNIKAWLWLSGAVEDEDERMMCLLTVLKLEPENEAATRGLAEIMAKRAVAEPSLSAQPASVEIAAAETSLDWTFDEAPKQTPGEGANGSSAAAEAAALVQTLESPAPAADEWTPEAAAGVPVEAAAWIDDRAAEESAASLFQVEETAEEPAAFESSLSTPAIEEWFLAEQTSPLEEVVAVEDLVAGSEPPVESAQAPVEESTQEIPVEKRKEKVIFSLSPSLGYGFAVMVLLLVVMAVIVVAALYYVPQWSTLIAAGGAVLWVLIAAGQLLTTATYRYFLTNKHLVIDKGFISRKRTAIPLAALDEVQLRQDVLQKILGVGDLTLTQAGEPHTARLKNVPKPKARQDEIETVWHPAPNEI